MTMVGLMRNGRKGVTKAVNEFINKNNITNMIRHGMTQYEIRL